MRRADRLFTIIQILRRRTVVRAQDLAEKLEISERTVYRDIADLVASGVPIEGEAGVGYMLRKEFDLPPLMFDKQEIEALVLGARIVESWADPKLAKAASTIIAKVESVLPERLRQYMAETALLAPTNHFAEPIVIDLSELRHAIRQRQKVCITYCDVNAQKSKRKLRPLALTFYGPIWVLASWCELREDFRSFRIDRIKELVVLEDTFCAEPGKTLNDFLHANAV